MPQRSPTVVYEDNQPCIAVTSDAAKPVGEHTKFYDMRVKKLKEMQSLGIIKVTYCRTASMLADLFTKNVNSVIFDRIAGVITGDCTGGLFSMVHEKDSCVLQREAQFFSFFSPGAREGLVRAKAQFAVLAY